MYNMNKKCYMMRLSENEHEALKLMAYLQRKSMNFILKQALREFCVKHSGKNGFLK